MQSSRSTSPWFREVSEPSTLLLVEDEDSVRKTLCRLLEVRGYRVFCAADEAEAFEMLARTTLSALVTDVILPAGGSGIHVAKRARETAPDLPIVFMSGYAPDLGELDERTRYLQKPFRTKTLFEALEGLLGDA